MAGICTASVSPNSCGHRTLTIQWDGQSYTIPHFDLDQPLTTEERLAYLTLSVRLLKGRGVSLAQFVNRVLIGEEATNVKGYTFFGPGVALVKTDIGTAYTNILPELNGGRRLVDFTGCTEFRVFLNGLLPGVGPYGARIVRHSNNAVLYENATIPANASERELDTGWVAIPAGFLPGAQEVMVAQAKSVTATDDPTYRRIELLVR
jgi:hypothetical protein